jgi:hypothetical protein
VVDRYYIRGREHRETSGSLSETRARRYLKQRIGEVASGKFIGPEAETLTFDSLAADLNRDYEINGKRSTKALGIRMLHLSPFFSGRRAIDITSEKVRRYVTERKAEGAANASINRELAALKRMFNLAFREGRIASVPRIPKLEENNAREGFRRPRRVSCGHSWSS